MQFFLYNVMLLFSENIRIRDSACKMTCIVSSGALNSTHSSE